MLFDTIFLISIGEIGVAVIGAIIVGYSPATSARFEALTYNQRDSIIVVFLFLALSGIHNLISLGIWGLFQ